MFFEKPKLSDIERKTYTIADLSIKTGRRKELVMYFVIVRPRFGILVGQSGFVF